MTERGGVCNPAANVSCEVTASEIPQNVSDGITNPVRLDDRARGVCNPAANVSCEATASEIPQNVSDGITNPVRLCYKSRPAMMTLDKHLRNRLFSVRGLVFGVHTKMTACPDLRKTMSAVGRIQGCDPPNANTPPTFGGIRPWFRPWTVLGKRAKFFAGNAR